MKGRITADLKAKGKRLIEVENARQLITYAKERALLTPNFKRRAFSQEC
jgi:hypothetical protein